MLNLILLTAALTLPQEIQTTEQDTLALYINKIAINHSDPLLIDKQALEQEIQQALNQELRQLQQGLDDDINGASLWVQQ
ncbi:hypothetical protein LZP69_04715 [Shewanella sp. AS1]|uniref:hypothetical protein n=1 Tax=Shewanella sp. AS1 TaxID=2907626 RepID=UPI001F1F0F03|nr:hypothetical protein [Shewanella sp. AS1]MCE9678496.1 hypothetical protein [Shewanella sp. AS1]